MLTKYNKEELELMIRVVNKILEYSYGQNNESLREIILKKVQNSYSKQEELSFILPSFPGKSPNNNSCFSHLPDYTENIAIETIKNFVSTIDNIYPYGCNFIIIHDGHFFYKLGITRTEDELNDYINEIRNKLPCNIISKTIYDLMNNYNLEEAYYLFKNKYYKKINCKVDLSSEVLFTKNEFFYKNNKNNLTNNQLQQISKKIAYESLSIKEAVSNLINEKFLDSIRFSVHYQDVNSKKMGFKLIPNAINKGTPWFYVAFVDDKNQIILGKKNWNFDDKILKHSEYGDFFQISENNVNSFINEKIDKKILFERRLNR